MQIIIVYIVIELYNFIKKIYSRNKKDIYYTLIDILDNAKNNNNISTMQSSLA